KIVNATLVRALGGSYVHNGKTGVYLSSCPGAQMIRNGFEDNQRTAAGAGPYDVQLFFESTNNFSVTGGHFENFAGENINSEGLLRRNAIGVSGCLGGYIGSSSFTNGPIVQGSTGILLWSGARSTVVGPNSWGLVDVLVSALDDNTITSTVVMPQ